MSDRICDSQRQRVSVDILDSIGNILSIGNSQTIGWVIHAEEYASRINSKNGMKKAIGLNILASKATNVSSEWLTSASDRIHAA